jgi:hypothetical protein
MNSTPQRRNVHFCKILYFVDRVKGHCAENALLDLDLLHLFAQEAAVALEKSRLLALSGLVTEPIR